MFSKTYVDRVADSCVSVIAFRRNAEFGGWNLLFFREISRTEASNISNASLNNYAETQEESWQCFSLREEDR